MNLVTISCTRDLNLLRLQANSIDRYVSEPCTHFVVIEDTGTPLSVWEEALRPFYSRHKLILSQGVISDQLDTHIGWIRQQVLKLTMAITVLTEHYLILDSKNFFIRPVDLHIWSTQEGNDTSFDCHWEKYEKWKPWMDHVQQTTGIKIPDVFWRLWPPFKLNTSVVRNLLNTVDVDILFSVKMKDQSEFLLYRFFNEVVPVTGKKTNHIFRFADDLVSADELAELVKVPTLLTLALHAKCLATKDPKLGVIQDWLVSSGYDIDVITDIFGQLNSK